MVPPKVVETLSTDERIAASGELISCAIPAINCPNAAIFSDSTNCDCVRCR